MDGPNSFVLYKNQWRGLRELNFTGLGMLFSAIFRYLNGEDSETVEKSLPPEVLVAFRFMMLQIDVDFAKYRDKLLKNAERQKEYRAKKQRNAHNKDKDNDNDKDNDKDNDNDIDNDNDNDNAADAAESGLHTSQPAAAATAAAEYKELKKLYQEKFVPWFNQLLDDHESRINRISRITDKRMARILEIERDYSRDMLFEAMRRAARSQFLNGRGKNKYVATFDWLISEEHFLHVLEGEYNTSRG